MEDLANSARTVGGKGLDGYNISTFSTVALIQNLVGHRRFIVGQISGEAVAGQIGDWFVAIARDCLLYSFADRGRAYARPDQLQAASRPAGGLASLSWPLKSTVMAASAM